MATATPTSFREWVVAFSPLSKGLAGVLLGGYVLQLAVPATKEYLGLVAGRTLARVWTVASSGLLEDHFLSLVAFTLGLLFVCRIVEPIYGSRELLRFLLVSLAATGTATFLLVTFVYYVAAFAGSADADHAGDILYRPICGFHGGFAALLVALKQLIPEGEVSLAGGLLKFRARHAASAYVLAVAALGLLLRDSLRLAPFAAFGAYSAWLYLRFFQQRGGDDFRGDPSDDFRFATFFPAPLQPAVDALASAAARLTHLAHAAAGDRGAAARQPSGAAARLGTTSYAAAAAAGALPGSEATEAQRRRERGAKALEERLGGGGGKGKAAAAATVTPPAAEAPPAPAVPATSALAAEAVDVEQGGATANSEN